jgi:hypothetical protein
MRTSSKLWYRKQNKTWYVEFGGKQVRLFKDKAEAKRKWLKLMAEGGPSQVCALQECVDHYLPTLRPATRRTREQTLTAFMKHVGKISRVCCNSCCKSRLSDHLLSLIWMGSPPPSGSSSVISSARLR